MSVVQIAEQIAHDAEFELRTGIDATRCACGASAIRLTDAGPVCAGCNELRPLPDLGHEPMRGEGVQDRASIPARVLDAEHFDAGHGVGGDRRTGLGLPRETPRIEALSLNGAPLRVIVNREVLANRTRLYLECGHALERAYTGWAHRARCGECLNEGRVR